MLILTKFKTLRCEKRPFNLAFILAESCQDEDDPYISTKYYTAAVVVCRCRIKLGIFYKDINWFSIYRAINGAGCQMVSPTGEANVCEFVWLMDCDYKVRVKQLE